MEFGILGPLVVSRDGVPVPVAGKRLRELLALLVLRANETVTPGEIAMALWGEEAPHDAVATVRVYVSRLRRAFDDRDVLVTMPTGYRLSVAPGDLDAERFERLADEGRRTLAAGDPARA